jgi:hypothetical protein
MMFGSIGRPMAQRANQLAEVIHSGSDANFVNQHFVQTSDNDTKEALETEALGYIDCLQNNIRPATTLQSSRLSHRSGNVHPLAVEPRNVIHGDDREASPQKRRKCKVSDEVDEREDNMAQSKASTARKPKVKPEGPVIAATSLSARLGGFGRRRRPSANESSKQPRENLSDEQKREHHNRRDRRRRTIIKEGFDDLCELVTGLKSGQINKSTMLAMSAEWLDQLIKGNELLKAQLAGLRGRSYI